MLKRVSNPTTLHLLENLVPNLVSKARAFSKPSFKQNSTVLKDGPILHSQIRDQIMASAINRPRVSDTAKNTRNALVTHIQRALGKEDLLEVLRHWKSLEDHKASVGHEGPAYGLLESTERKMCLLFKRRYWKSINDSNWDDDANNIAQIFAVQAATHGFADALYALMLAYIQKNDPQAALDIYRRFSESLKEPETNKDEQLISLIDEDAEPDMDPFRVSALLAAITAHAMTNSFPAAFATFTESNIRIPAHRKKLFFQGLKVSSDDLTTARKFVDNLEILSWVSKPSMLSKHIMNIAHPRSAPLLLRLYTDILEGINGPNPFIALKESDLSDTRLVVISQAIWTSFQTGFIRCERRDLAAKLWDDLAQHGIQPDVTMWTGLLDVYADLRDSTQAMQTWNLMLQQNVLPDELSYRAMIQVLFDDNKPEEAVKRFQEFRQTFKEPNTAALAVYNTLLKGLLRTKRLADAIQVLSAMLKQGPYPDVVSFNTLLGYYKRHKDFKSLSAIVNQMNALKIPGDVVTFSTILSALLQVGEENAHSVILGIMRKQGVLPNVATYTAIIDHQMREQSEASLRASLKLLDKMEQDPSLKPNEVTYTTILSGLYRARWADQDKVDEVRQDITSRMRRFNVSFRLPTYHTLIQAALDSKHADGYKNALALIQEMEDQDMPRVNNTWYILFKGLIRLGQWDVAAEMVRKMRRCQHKPTESLNKVVDIIMRRS